MSVVHRAWMERGDLVVILVGRDKRLCGELFLDHGDAITADTFGIHPIGVRLEVATDGCHGFTFATE